MSKLTSHERAMTEGTSFDSRYVPPYVEPDLPIQVFKDGQLQPLPDEQPKPAQWAGCTCATCASGRSRAYAPFTREIDRLIAVLIHGSDEQQQQLRKLLDIE
jgi:hypothetical protein